jgi:hypothetical protein
MTKLTNVMRDSICAKLLAHATDARKAEHKEAGTALAIEILQDVLGDSYKRLASAPTGWLPTTTHVEVRVGDMGWNRIECDAMPIPDSKKGGCLQVYDATSKFGEKVMAYGAEARAMVVDRNKMQSEINAILRSCGTVNKLLETWPDVRPFLNIAAPVKALPMVRIDVLNGKLGLPIEGAAQGERAAS